MNAKIFDNFNDFMWDADRARQCKIHYDSPYKFWIAFSKPLDPRSYDNGWLTAYIKYETQKFSMYAGISEKPLPDFNALSKSLVELPKSFADQVASNSSFIKTLQMRLAEYAKKHEKEGASFDEVFDILKSKGVSVDRNNTIAKTTAHNAEQVVKAKATKDELTAFAKKYGHGQKWDWYKEYYRGPSAPAHDDDYEGSGELSFEDVVLALCKNEKEVKKLAAAPSGTKLEKTIDRYRTLYTKR